MFPHSSAGVPWPLEEKAAPEKVLQPLDSLHISCSIYFCISDQSQSFYERKILICKGHKHERNKPGAQTILTINFTRVVHVLRVSITAAHDADIAKRMSEMPKMIQTWREEQKKARTKTELQKILSVPAKFGKQ